MSTVIPRYLSGVRPRRYREVTLAWITWTSPDGIEAVLELITPRGIHAAAAMTTRAASRSQKCVRLLISGESIAVVPSFVSELCTSRAVLDWGRFPDESGEIQRSTPVTLRSLVMSTCLSADTPDRFLVIVRGGQGPQGGPSEVFPDVMRYAHLLLSAWVAEQ